MADHVPAEEQHPEGARASGRSDRGWVVRLKGRTIYVSTLTYGADAWSTKEEAEKSLMEQILLNPKMGELDFEIVPSGEMSPSDKWNSLQTWDELTQWARSWIK